MKINLINQIESFKRYLHLRYSTPHELRLEAVFSFRSWREVEDLLWPQDPQYTHGKLAETFLNSGAIVLLKKADFQKQIYQCLGYVYLCIVYFLLYNFFFIIYFRYLKLLTEAIETFPEALPSLKNVQDVYDYENVVRFIMYGSLKKVGYCRFLTQLLHRSIEASTNDRGVVVFKRLFPPATKKELYVPDHVKLPYPFLASIINKIIDYLSIDPVPSFSMEKCIERFMLLAGCFSRQMCGLGVADPTKSTVVFSSKQLDNLKGDSLLYKAVLDENYLTVQQVSKHFSVHLMIYLCLFTLITIIGL